MRFNKCLLNPPTLLGNSDNYPFLNSDISANHHVANREILITLNVPLVNLREMLIECIQ